MPDDRAADCLRLLRRFREATLGFGDRRAPIRFVLDRTTGELVMPVEPEAIRHAAASDGELTLYLPSEADCDATAMLAAAPIKRPEAHEGVDRWSAYHGDPPTAAPWIACRILGIKSTTEPELTLVDEAALTMPNPLGVGGAEFRLVRQANADRDALAALCRRLGRASVRDPVCVGVDPHGLDVRAPFGIVRVEFPAEAPTPDAAAAAMSALLSTHDGAGA